MQKTKKQSKLKTWFKNLFKTKKSSQSKTLPLKETIPEEQERLCTPDSQPPPKYSYLKTPEQVAFYENLRRVDRQRPKYKKIKNPRIKKNQEGGPATNSSATRQGHLRRRLPLLLHVQSALLRRQENLRLVSKPKALSEENPGGVRHREGFQPRKYRYCD